jgi:membrane protein involved in colicin uptake
LPEFAFEASEVYKTTLDMNKAISEGKRLSEIARRKAEHEEAMKAKAEAEAQARAEAEARAKAEEIQPDTDLNTLESGAYTVRDTREDAPKPIEKEWISFKALLSREDALALRDFFNSKKIEFKAI